MFSNEKKEEKEPQYYMSAVNIPVYNYKVYYLSIKERLLYTLVAFIAGAAVAYLFYGGIGADEYGNPTTFTYVCNTVLCVGVGCIAVKLFVPGIVEMLQKRNVNKLRSQFRDMLDSLTTSLNAGKNVADSFLSVYEDLQLQYDEGSFILKELQVIIAGMNNNIEIENLILDLGYRSGIDDINSFGNVFKMSYRKGGNIKEIIKNTHQIISEKMEIEEEIRSMVSSNKMEQNMMTVMPIVIVFMLKGMDSDMASNFTSGAGLISITIASVLFVASYFVGKAVLKIKV